MTNVIGEISRKGKGLGQWYFKCPGCKIGHSFYTDTEKSPCWSFNGDLEKPTFHPSLLVTMPRPKEDGGDEICHSFVTDGQIRFLGDCTHALAGQTVPLEDVDG